MAIIEMDSTEPNTVRAGVVVDHGDKLSGLQLRIHKARKLAASGAQYPKGYSDRAVDRHSS
jgi:hypothetical protein